MDLGLKNKNAIVTGGSQGVGFAIAEGLAREGCNIALGARGQDKLEESSKELEKLGVTAVPIVIDFSTSEGCNTFVSASAEKLGGIDIVINNVGGMVPGNIESITDEEWQDTVDRNLMSYIWTSRAAVPHLRKSTAGRVLSVSGLSGTQLLPGSWSTTITNAGIHGMTKLLASEMASENITVNAIAPGTVKTEAWMGPRADAVAKARGISSDEVRKIMAANAMLDRLAEPEEIGDVAAFLVSEKNSYMTGTVVEVCGGWGKYIG
ncbi:MAG: SDR family oxidoreductase [Pseudomonadota bacterium]|nr:SDR family oxidoreductase [Pseudomonadota bacterium]